MAPPQALLRRSTSVCSCRPHVGRSVRPGPARRGDGRFPELGRPGGKDANTGMAASRRFVSSKLHLIHALVETLAVAFLERGGDNFDRVGRSSRGRRASRPAREPRRCRARRRASTDPSGSCTSGSGEDPLDGDDEDLVGEPAALGESARRAGSRTRIALPLTRSVQSTPGTTKITPTAGLAKRLRRCRSGGCRGGRGSRGCARRARGRSPPGRPWARRRWCRRGRPRR